MVGDPVAARPQRAVHDALDASAVQRDEGVGPVGTVPLHQVPNAAQISGAFLADRRGEQHGAVRRDTRAHHGFTQGDKGGEAARVVGDPGSLESSAAARD